MTNKEIIDLTERHVTGTYRRFPVAIVKGEGVRVWDAESGDEQENTTESHGDHSEIGKVGGHEATADGV